MKLFSNLEKQIKHQAQKYYNDGSSELSDSEFDALVDELRVENPESELLNVGWGYSVDQDNTPGEKVNHKYGVVGSLDKCHNAKELGSEFLGDTCDVSLKLDGISVALYYEQGALVRALTRGDGYTGIDITNKIKVINPVAANELIPGFTGCIRGEILMSFAKFEQLKQIDENAKNPRNSTAGIIGADDPGDQKLKLLDVIVYSIIGDECGLTDNFSVFDMREFLEQTKWPTAPHKKLLIDSVNLQHEMDKLKTEWYSEYPADGIVITKSTLKNEYSISLKAKAFKFPAEAKVTTVKEVKFELTKSRKMTPVVYVDPVELSGTTVIKCHGYNAKYIKDNHIVCGTKVLLRKSGEIIPQIVSVIQESKAPVILPDSCPHCQSKLVWSGVDLVCNSANCTGADYQDLNVWCNALFPLDNFGEKLRDKFLKACITDLTVDNLYSKKDDIIVKYKDSNTGHEGLMHQFIDMVFGSYPISLKKALVALNVPRLGEVTAAKLATRPDIVKHLYTCAIKGKPDIEDFSNFIGSANMVAILSNIHKFAKLKYILDRIDFSKSTDLSLSRGKVAITGKLSVPRSALEKEIKSAGYSVGDVGKDTAVLIIDDLSSSSSKNQKAIRLGIPRVSEAEFRAKYLH